MTILSFASPDIRSDWYRRIPAGFLPMLIVLCCVLPVYGQVLQSAGPSYGGYIHYTKVIYTADFYTLPGTSLSQANEVFTTGSGNGLAAGIVVDLPFSSVFSNASIASQVHLGLRAGYEEYSGYIKADERRMMVRRNGSPVVGTIGHTLHTTMSYAMFEPIIGFSPFTGFQLHIGGQVALPLSATYVHSEAITWPDPNSLAPGAITDADESGDIPNLITPAVAALAGVSAVFPLDKKQQLTFVPELFVSIPITDISGDVYWQASSVRAGISLLYRPAGEPVAPPDTIIIRDTVDRFDEKAPKERVYFVETDIDVRTGRQGEPDAVLIREQYIRERPKTLPELHPQLVVLSAAEGGANAKPIEALVVEEHSTNSLTPLLTYVFFDSASARLPSRYLSLSPEEAAVFAPGKIVDSAMAVYRHLLNIVGHRMRDNPKTILTLTGCNDGLEEKNTGVSRRRAESVRDYLVRAWSIEPSRFRVQERNLPDIPSNPNTDEGAEENRRVELHFNDAAMEQPVFVADTTMLMQTNRVLLKPTVDGDIGLWRLVLSRGEQVLYSVNGETALPDTLEWRPDPVALSARGTGPVTALLAVRRRGAGVDYTATQNLPVRIRTIREKQAEQQGDIQTDRYSLLLFEFDGSRLTPLQRDVITTIKQHFQPGDKVTVIGSTDKIGDADYNRRLSLSRAQAVAKALGFPAMDVQGAGEDVSTYPNDIPEGRFYSRTVTVVVERTVRAK